MFNIFSYGNQSLTHMWVLKKEIIYQHNPEEKQRQTDCISGGDVKKKGGIKTKE